MWVIMNANAMLLPAATRLRTVLLGMALFLACLTQATVLRVSVAGSGADGQTWQSAYTSLSQALANAVGPTEIWLREGVYYEFLSTTVDDIGLYGGFAGDEQALSERHGGDSIIDAYQQARVLKLTSANNWTIDRVRFRGGLSYGFGAGVYVSSCQSLTMTNCVVEDCATAMTNSAGGMYVSSGSVRLTDCTIQRCSSTDTGGGMRAIGPVLELTRVTFAENSAVRGGGLALEGGSGYVLNCTFRHNLATATGVEGGGGLWLKNVRDVQVSRNFFTQNLAPSGYGSALDVNTGTVLSFYNNIFSRNQAKYATIVVRDASSWPRFINNTTSDNTSTVGNSAYYLANQANGTFRNENICFNTGPQAAVGRDVSSAYNWAYGNFYQNSVAPFTLPADLVAAGMTTTQSNPQFLNRILLDDPFSYQLLPTSTLIDYGYDEAKEDFNSGKRPVNVNGLPLAYPDKGCFEYQGVQQFALLANWLGPQLNGDQSTIKLDYEVKDAQGHVALTGSVPQTATGFYTLHGDILSAGSGPFRILLSAKGYLKRAIDVASMPAQGSPGINVTLTPGDVDGDNVIGLYDLNVVVVNFNTGSAAGGDINGDGNVDLLDLNLVIVPFHTYGDE